jgi:membrane-anchored protein YejM (alkaline phosphatase superfamily)
MTQDPLFDGGRVVSWVAFYSKGLAAPWPKAALCEKVIYIYMSVFIYKDIEKQINK